MITGCPDCPHQGDGNSQAGLQAHINRAPGPTVVDAALALAADRPSVTDNARAEEQSGYTVQQTAAHFARSVQRVSDRIQRTDYRRSVVDVVALESVQGFLDRIARDDLGVYADGPAETTTATTEDIATRVRCAWCDSVAAGHARHNDGLAHPSCGGDGHGWNYHPRSGDESDSVSEVPEDIHRPGLPQGEGGDVRTPGDLLASARTVAEEATHAAYVEGAGTTLATRDLTNAISDATIQALAAAGLLRTRPTREEVDRAVGAVLFNAMNHPTPVAVLGKDIGPLQAKVTDAVLALLRGGDRDE